MLSILNVVYMLMDFNQKFKSHMVKTLKKRNKKNLLLQQQIEKLINLERTKLQLYIRVSTTN